jgi:thiol reductant ABC exporter CydC subunit
MKAPLRRTFALARPARGRLALATLLGACASGAAIGLMGTSAWLISRAAQRPQESAVAIAIVAVQFFAFARALCRYGERLAGHDAAFRALARVRVEVYERLERLAPLGLPAFRSGDLLARLVGDVDELQELMLRVAPPFAIALVVGAAAVGLEWWMLPAAGTILLAGLAIAGVGVPWLTGVLATRRELRQAHARGQLSVSVLDLLEGGAELAANGATTVGLARARVADERLTRISLASARTAGVGLGLTSLCTGLAMWGALLVGVAGVRDGEMNGVLLAGLALVALAAFELVGDLPGATQALARVCGSAARVFEVLDTREPVPAPARPLMPSPSPTGAHELRVRNLSFTYPGAPTPALSAIDLDLGAGRRMAVVGASGAGKSTLAGVLLRFLAYEGGSAKLDGVEIAALDGDGYRRVVGLMSQEAHVFDSTLEENLRLARRDASPEQLREALARAQLLEWADSLPAGLATELGERGERMSGGQRRRLALARVLLADFPVLILDEPGEHLDTETADELLADVLALGAGRRATLLITHRLAGLQELDEILVLERGTVLERGAHGELLARDGRYAELWQRERESAWAMPGAPPDRR